VQADDDEQTIVDTIAREGYSRIPVFAPDGECIEGILHTREYLLHRSDESFALVNVELPAVFVPETAHLDMLLKDMQKNHRHMVIVVNEYGRVSGIVTMEDIIEQLVGEIWDEQDVATEEIVPIGESTYRVLSASSLESFCEFFEVELDGDTQSTTVNGWLSERCGCIPPEGSATTYGHLTITVARADALMTHELTVTVAPQNSDEETEKSE
jgi:putative hemolysin